MAIVDKITELIKKSGYNSIAAFEKQIGLGNGIIGKWKKQSPSCDKIALVADNLNCSVDYLLDREQPNGNKILSPSENELIDGYRKLSEQGQEYIQHQMTIATEIYKKQDIHRQVEQVV